MRKGMKVNVKNAKGEWYPGQISYISKDQRSCTIAYTDGTEEEEVTADRIRFFGTGDDIGGVLFLDEAYDLEPAKNANGAAILAEIMQVAEQFRDRVTIILAGYQHEIEDKLYSFNSGMPSRFETVRFQDFSKDQFEELWEKNVRDSGWECDAQVAPVVARRMVSTSYDSAVGKIEWQQRVWECSIAAQAF